MKYILFLFIFLLSIDVSAQKKVIDHTVYDDWKTLSSSAISNDGKIITYEIKPHKGDGYLYIYHVDTKKLDSIYRATGAKIAGNGSYVAFKITPGYDTLRTCELKKIDKKKWPKDSLGIYTVANDSLTKWPKLKSFYLNEDDDWGFFSFDHNELKEKKVKKYICKKKRPKPYESKGNLLMVYHPTKGKKEYKDIMDFDTNEKMNIVALLNHKKEKIDSMGFTIVNLLDFSEQKITQRHVSIEKMVFNEDGKWLAYLTSNDTAKVKNFDLRLMDTKTGMSSIIVDSTNSAMPQGKSVSMNYQPFFTKEGNRLYFGVADTQLTEPKDTLIESEKVKLDLWHYKDQRLQPEQLVELKNDEKKTNLFVYLIGDKRAVQLSNDTLEVQSAKTEHADILLGYSRERYMFEDSWSSPRKSDYYSVSVNDGSTGLLSEGELFGVDLAPSGKSIVVYDNKDQQYYSRHYSTEEDSEGIYREICLTCDIKGVNWTEDINGMPMDAYPFGVIGWEKGEDKVFIQSQYDVWYYSYSEQKLTSLSDNLGKEKGIEIRPKFWSQDSVYIDFENVYFEGFDTKTKGTHLFDVTVHDNHFDFTTTAYYDAKITQILASKNREQYLMRKMTFTEYPEIEIFSDDIKDLQRISVTNPQQDEYNWGTVELVDWKSYSGLELQGLLYKPEDFDPSKSYPLMVYFYELYTDNFHTHYIPKPTASIIFATEYASAGYVVFMPDIRYTPGYPAKSAYDCIMSGTDRVLELLPNIDSNRMALQGQSWGGYQTAQLITMTKRYAAAMAGAPVSNMFSAYGGIRWGTGINRQFQYEKTQSRIGHTIWEKPELYIENSPLFHVPKITTPLLIMHNDADGAVPWYQSIEMFTAMKRLGKQAWLLNYNGDDHNLMQNANRIDLSIRMRQFFDHYLKGEPAPKWLTDGIPAIKKGEELRYEKE